MKVWALAGLFTAVMAPFAAAVENSAECQLDDTRRATQPRVEAPSTPTPTARTTSAAREAAEQSAPRAEAQRRRSGKRIPDAELIGPRGAL